MLPMPDSAVETPTSNQVPDIYFLTKAGISAEKAQEILDKKKIAAENVDQAKIAGSELYERVALGYAVTELNLGSGVLQLAMESPTTGNLTEKIKEGLAGLNPTPPKDEEMAIFDGIATKALVEKDFPAAVKALILACDDPNLEKPEVLKRLQDSTQGDEEEQLKLAQVLSELLPKKEIAPNPAPDSAPTETPKMTPEPIKTDSATPIPTETTTPDYTFVPTKFPEPTSTPTKTITITPTETPTPTIIANEPQIPEPTAAPDLSGYALPQINAMPPSEVPATELNLAGTRPQTVEATNLPDALTQTTTPNSAPSQIEVTADQTLPGLRLVPDQPNTNLEPGSDIKPSGILNKLPISNPFKRAA